MEIEKIEFREAVSILAREAWVEMKTDFLKEKREKWEDIYALYREATTWYHEALFFPENKKALDYLLGRQISLETIKKFQLGYSSSPRDLLFFLREKWFAPKFIIDSWLFVSETRDKFYGRILFPIANSMWHTVAFTGRVMDDSLPKYLNSPVSHIFDKSSILYGMHLAKQSISKAGYVYIVEWQMDTIALHQAWVDTAVGISGTALTKDHIRSLRRFCSTVYLSLDSDNAWVKATFSSIENLLWEDLEIRIIQIPNGKDPDEFIKQGWDFSLLRESALSAVQFYLIEWRREFDIQTIIGKKKLIEKCLEIVARLQNQVEIDFYLQEISHELSVSMDALYAEYKKIRMHVLKSKNTQKNPETENSWSNSVFSPTLADTIAGYIYRYQFLDLFSREFRYTEADLTDIPEASLLHKVVYGTLDSDDQELLGVLDLHLEQDHIDANPGLIERAFRDLLRSLHQVLVENEKQKKLSNISPDSSEYLQILSEIMKKEVLLGLRR